MFDRIFSRNKSAAKTLPVSERQLKAKLLPAMVALLCVLYILTGFRGWLVFLIGMVEVWLIAIIWVLSLQRGLSIERKIHLPWAQVGDSVPEEIILKNRSRLPALWVEIVDESESLPDPVRLVTDVEARTSRRRHPIHQFKRRGLYNLGPTRLQTGDPFGIYSLTLRDSQSNSILITPPQIALPWLHIAPGSRAGDRQLRHQALEREISDTGVREYAPGDSLRRIHWRVSAHFEALIVRQLESTKSGDWQIFVDLEASAQNGRENETTLELSIIIAASLVGRGFKEHHRVGLAFVGPELVWLEPRTGSAHMWQMLRSLSMAGPGDHSLAQLLSLRHPGQNVSLIVITPSTDTSWVAVAGRGLRGEDLTTLLVDPRDFGGKKDQNLITTYLSRRGIPFTRMPGELLTKAYASSSQSGSKHPGSMVSQRYLGNKNSIWKSMD
jgi:uncharacterized protein (DUF58 family)